MGEDRFGNFSSCCRICLSDKFNDLKPIFEDEAESRTLVQRILHFLGVEVSPNDKISTMICSQCRSKVNNWDSFKRVCIKNQSKLNDWLNSWNAASQGSNNIGHAVIQVKDEPIDADEVQMLEDSTEEQGITIKDEQNEEFYELPPQLTPNSRNEIDDLQTVSLVNGYGVSSVVKNSKQCTFCYKLFSTSGNRMKHERLLHNNRKSSTPAFFGKANSNLDDNSQQSMESHLSSSILTETSNIDSETDNPEKIQFAAGLRLKQKSTDSTTASLDSQLTSIEIAYIERNKALVTMLHRFRCACHNVSFPTIKRFFAHLRMSYTWFPVFTCYNCVITFSTRSLSMKHTGKCPRPYLENSLRMSEVKGRSESKIRLYQYSKCRKCENLYAYYEDFCDHIDKEHITEPPFLCLCSKEFDSAEEFKQHAYTCFLSFYCDVCYLVFETVKDFCTHCEEEHDKIEGYSFITLNDTFENVTRTEIVASRKRTHDEMVKDNVAENGEKIQDEEVEEGNPRKKIIPAKLYNEPTTCELCEKRFTSYHALRKHMKGHRRTSIANGWKHKSSSCDKCGKVFSTYYNMIRHYKVHDDAEKHLQCALCTERFRLVSELKDHLILVHGRANVCQECGRQFESVKELEQHRAVHLNIKVYRDSETQSYRTSAKPKHTCELCESVFDSEDELNEHVALHNNISHMSVESVEKPDITEAEDKKDFGRFSCSDCDRHYVSYKGLWLHNRRHHPERKPAPQTFPCQYCDRVLQTNAAYQMHKQMHERMQERMQKQAALPPPLPQSKGDEDDESYFTCKHCFKVFSTKYNLKTHLKTHGIFVSPGRTYSKSGKFVKTFWCDICHQACQGYAELQKHKQEHIREKLKESHTMQMVEVILEEEEDIKPQIFSCDICTKGFLSKVQLIQHKAIHEQENKATQKKNFVYCKYCKIPYLNVESLNRHMEQEHNEIRIQKPKVITKKHQCNLCKKSFDTAGALCSHQGWHKRGKSEKQLKSDRVPRINVKHECTSCNLTFLTDAALQVHISEAHRNVHAQVAPSRCSICNIEFKTQASYDEHARLHKTTSTAFQCKYCTRKFNKSETFNIHVNESHPEHAEHKFKCHQCGRILEKQNALTIHLKMHDRQRLAGAPIKRTTPKPHVYKCSICHLGFEIPKDLRNHIITNHPF